jgi:hypothetical protein
MKLRVQIADCADRADFRRWMIFRQMDTLDDCRSEFASVPRGEGKAEPAIGREPMTC